jgi:hypothetical protein
MVLSKIYRWPALFISLILIFSSFGLAKAALETTQVTASESQDSNGNATCSNLDVIFILDQSKSMSYPPSQASDPLEQRKFAVDSMVDLLTGLSLDQCPGTANRIAVISYGSQINVDLPFYDVAPQTADAANSLRDEQGPIKSKIIATDMGSTYPLPAFVEAQRMFRRTGDLGDGVRKKVIIFLTDGIPSCDSCAHGIKGEVNRIRETVNDMLPFDKSLLARESCLTGLRDKYKDEPIPGEDTNKCIADYPVGDKAYEQSTYIWTVFLKPPDFQTGKNAETFDEIIRGYQDMSQSHAGQMVELKPNSRKEVPTTFRRIISALAGVRPVLLSCGNFAVAPYLREARVTIYKLDPDLKVTLSYTDSDGILHNATDGHADASGGFDFKNYYSFGPNESYIFGYPYPGIWKLTADNCNGLDTYYEKVNINPSGYQLNIPASVPEYDINPYFDSSKPYYLEYQMRDETGVIVSQANHPRFAIEAKAVVTDQKNNQVTYPLKWMPSDKLFRSEQPLQIPIFGTYSVQITGMGYTYTGQPSISTDDYNQIFTEPMTLFDQKSSFEAFKVNPFVLQVLEPKADSIISSVHDTILGGFKVQPVLMRVRITDREGQPVTDVSDYFVKPESAITAQLIADSKTSDLINLSPDPGSPGDFTGEIADFEVLGNQKLTISVNDDSLVKTARPDKSTIETNFQRIDTLLSNPKAYPIMTGILLATLIGWVVYSIAIRTNKVRGTLIFQGERSITAQFPMSSGKNWFEATPKALRSYPELLLKRIRVTNLPKAGNVIADGSLDGGGGPGVKVEFTPDKGKKYSINLYPDAPVPYADSFLMVMYKPL